MAIDRLNPQPISGNGVGQRSVSTGHLYAPPGGLSDVSSARRCRQRPSTSRITCQEIRAPEIRMPIERAILARRHRTLRLCECFGFRERSVA